MIRQITIVAGTGISVGTVVDANGNETDTITNSAAASATTILRANHAGTPYTPTNAQQIVFVDVSGGVVTIHSPVAPVDGQSFTVDNTAGDASVSNITVDAAGGKTLQDPNSLGAAPAASIALSVKGASATWIWGATENQWRLV
jgi:hypothetical protein